MVWSLGSSICIAKEGAASPTVRLRFISMCNFRATKGVAVATSTSSASSSSAPFALCPVLYHDIRHMGQYTMFASPSTIVFHDCLQSSTISVHKDVSDDRNIPVLYLFLRCDLLAHPSIWPVPVGLREEISTWYLKVAVSPTWRLSCSALWGRGSSA